MGVGYLGLFDRVDHTASSEYASRQGERITTCQVHHTAGTSDSGARALMDPGGRTVSSNGLLLRDGTLVEVVPGQFRAFTSASGFDRQSLTVETVNQTGPDEWGISEKQRLRLAKLHRDMAAAGLPTTPGKRGVGGLIGHYEVPGTYPTACPGPSMYLDHIAKLSVSMPAGGGYEPIIVPEEDTMFPIQWNGHLFTFGQQFVKHETNGAHATFVRNVLTADDKFIVVDDAGFTALCESFGIPWDAIAAVLKGAAPGQHGRVWSRELEVLAELRALAGKPAVDPALVKSTIEDAIAAAEISATVDVDAIAGAVDSRLADDFDRLPQAVRDEIVAPD